MMIIEMSIEKMMFFIIFMDFFQNLHYYYFQFVKLIFCHFLYCFFENLQLNVEFINISYFLCNFILITIIAAAIVLLSYSLSFPPSLLPIFKYVIQENFFIIKGEMLTISQILFFIFTLILLNVILIEVIQL